MATANAKKVAVRSVDGSRMVAARATLTWQAGCVGPRCWRGSGWRGTMPRSPSLPTARRRRLDEAQGAALNGMVERLLHGISPADYPVGKATHVFLFQVIRDEMKEVRGTAAVAGGTG